MRLFVAVDVPGSVLDQVSAVEPALREWVPSVRWTRREGRHLTLAFLGEKPGAELVVSALRGVRIPRFEMSLGELGVFGSWKRPRVVWIGVGRGTEELGQLAAAVQEALVPVGFEPESRPFTAHLTLARIKEPSSAGEPPAVSVPKDAFEVSDFVLYESLLRRDGAVYTPLERFELT